MRFIITTEAQTCFNDKLPSFVMDSNQSSNYVWMTVIITKDDRYLIKGGYVQISSSNFPGVTSQFTAIAGLFDTQTNTFIWIKAFQDEFFESPMITAISLNFNETVVVFAGTCIQASQSFYFFVDPMTGAIKYPSFKIQHQKDFHFLTSQSIILAGETRLYSVGTSMCYGVNLTLECGSIGQNCGACTTNVNNPDPIQYFVFDYKTSTILWHKIAYSGQVVSLVNVNPTATINGQENIIMGGGYSPVASDQTMTQWVLSFFQINPISGQLNLIGINITGSPGYPNTFIPPLSADYGLITNIEVYTTSTQWTLFFMSQSRNISTNGQPDYRRYICKINFSDASFTAATTILCHDYSLAPNLSWCQNSQKSGIKYDPTNNALHHVISDSNRTQNNIGNFYSRFFLGNNTSHWFLDYSTELWGTSFVFTNKPLITLTNGAQIFPGYSVGYKWKFMASQFSGLSTDLTFTFGRVSAVTYPFNHEDTCSSEIYGVLGSASYFTLMTVSLTSQSNFAVVNQTSQMISTRFYKAIDYQSNLQFLDSLCGASVNQPITIKSGSFHNVNLFINESKLYNCSFTPSTLVESCTDLNPLTYSIDESAIVYQANIFTVDKFNSKLLIQIQNQTKVSAQKQTVTVNSATTSNISTFFTFCVNIVQGFPPTASFDACTQPTCLTDVDTITVSQGLTPENFTYYIGSQDISSVKIDSFNVSSLGNSCFQLCKASDIFYKMKIIAVNPTKSTNFFKFDKKSRTVSWNQSDLTSEGQYLVQITGSIGRNTPISDSILFMVTIIANQKPNFTFSLKNGAKYNDTTISVCNFPNDILTLGPIEVNDLEQKISIDYQMDPSSSFFQFNEESVYIFINRSALMEKQFREGIQKYQAAIILSDQIQQKLYKVNFIVTNISCQVFNLTDKNENKKDILSQNNRPYFMSITVNNEGLLKVYFSEPLVIPSNISAYNQSVLDVSLIEPFSSQNNQNFKFQWNVTDFKSNFIQIQLQFDKPLYISASGKDKIAVKIIDTSFFLSKALRVPIIDNSNVIKNLPAQLSKSLSANKVLQATAVVSGQVSQGVQIGTLVSNALMSCSMSQLWNSVNSLQIISYLTYFNVYIPANVQIFFKTIFDIANLNIIPTELIQDKLYVLLQEDQDDNDPKTQQAIKNIANLLIQAIIMISMLPLWLIFKFLSNCDPFFNKIFIKVEYGIFWNWTIRYFIQSYFTFTLLALDQIYNTGLKWQSHLRRGWSVFLIVLITLYVILPISLTFYFRRNLAKFRQYSFLNKFSDIMQDFNFRSISSSNFIAIFCYRRLIQIILIIFVKDYPFAQIQIITLTCQTVLIVFGYSDVMYRKNKQVIEFFNDFMILVCVYHIYLFTDFVDDPEVRYQIGYSLIISASLLCLVNLCMMIVDTLFQAIRQYKLLRQKYRKWVHQRKMKKRKTLMLQQLNELQLKRLEDWYRGVGLPELEDPWSIFEKKPKIKQKNALSKIIEESEESNSSSNISSSSDIPGLIVDKGQIIFKDKTSDQQNTPYMNILSDIFNNQQLQKKENFVQVKFQKNNIDEDIEKDEIGFEIKSVFETDTSLHNNLLQLYYLKQEQTNDMDNFIETKPYKPQLSELKFCDADLLYKILSLSQERKQLISEVKQKMKTKLDEEQIKQDIKRIANLRQACKQIESTLEGKFDHLVSSANYEAELKEEIQLIHEFNN